MGQMAPDDGQSPSTPQQVRIPLSALAQPNQEDVMETPGAGDTITFTVDGTLDKVDGDYGLVTPNAVNGKPLEEEAQEPTPEDTTDTEGDDLQNEAQQMSQPGPGAAA